MRRDIELPIEQIRLDLKNPRIANYLEMYDENDIDSNTIALLLGTSSDSCAALRDSIKENGGIINPIIVNRNKNDIYTVIEGNTRLQIYIDFQKKGVPGNWNKIRAIVYDNLSEEDMDALRLQAHLVGPREWDAYSKAKYLDYLANTKYMPMSRLIAFCGGNTKANEIKRMIAGYRDMEEYYRPLCNDDTMFNIKKFHGFVELQRRNVLDALKQHGLTKTDFSQWMVDDKFDKLEDVRQIPKILNSKEAYKIFKRDGSKAAKKVLAVEEISPDNLKDVPYEMLAKELDKRMNELPYNEIKYLRTDAEYRYKIDVLKDVVESVQMLLEEVEKKNR